MSVLLGLLLAAGLLLVASPRLWPRREARTRRVERTRLRLLLDGAGWERMSEPTFLAICALASVLVAGLTLGITGVPTVSALGALAGAATPVTVARWRLSVRLASSRRSWPDVIDHLTASVRSGLALPEAVAALAAVGPQELRPAFATFGHVYGATGQFDSALDDLKMRLADPVADRILETLRMAREVGGTELTGVLRSLAQHLRAEAAVRAELEARQSWVANSARLGVAAPWIVLLLLCTRAETAAAFSSPGGVALLLGGAALSVLAYRIMKRIGRLPTEQRVFA